MDKRYQVFVSSTYTDLKEERQLVTQTLMKMDCIPAGMELFPASDEEQFEFIKRVIDDCDYYLLIIGGRYGSVTEEGISYTEKEYDYAREKGLKVVALLHGNPGSIPVDKSESSEKAKEKLAAFREKASKNRLVEFWTDKNALAGQVAIGMMNAMKLFPAVGWIRANRAASEDVLSEINALRQENEQLKQRLQGANTKLPDIEDLASLEDTFEIHGITYTYGSYNGSEEEHDWITEVTWLQLFETIAPYLTQPKPEKSVNELIAGNFRRHSNGSSFTDTQDFQTIKIQFQFFDLIELTHDSTDNYWSLTPTGQKLMFERRVVRKGEKTKEYGK